MATYYSYDCVDDMDWLDDDVATIRPVIARRPYSLDYCDHSFEYYSNGGERHRQLHFQKLAPILAELRQKMKCRFIKEELMMVIWHPDRLFQKWILVGFDPDD